MPAPLLSLAARRLPWWAVLAIGGGCVALGSVLTADPSRSISVLEWLAGAALFLTGVAELAGSGTATRPRLTRTAGALWIAAGVVAVAWPGLTIRTLALVVGSALVLGGVLKLRSAFFDEGDERFLVGLSGTANVVVGLLALAWPGVSVIVLAILFGIRTFLLGVAQIALAFRLRSASRAPLAERRWPKSLRMIGTAGVLVFAVAAGVVSASIDRAAPGAPSAFYTVPAPLPNGPPGTIIRSEVIADFHTGATTYRVLYKSTGYDGKPTAVSGFIAVPQGSPPPGGRKVLAYAHGTVGVATSCAPSLAKPTDQPLFLEGGAALLAAGYVIASSDYQGLGTPGPHPYLVGDSEAMDELDAVRAARNLTQAHAGRDFAVWGHSQGGQAALFTGQLAASYAPELNLVGVAAGGPVPNLIDLFRVNIKTVIGRVLISMGLQSWASVYHDANLDQIVSPAARPIVRKIAQNCLYSQQQILGSLPGTLALRLVFLHTPPWEAEPWKTIAAANAPGQVPIKAPLLIVQGAADAIVAPTVTEGLARKLCQNGETVEFRLLPGVGHIETGHAAAPAVASWVAARFAGKPAPTNCK